MNGFSKLSLIGFLMLLLVGAVYFNSQVQFNPVSARWEINEDYRIKDSYVTGTIIETDLYYLDFDGNNDSIYFDHDLTGNLSYIEFTIRNFDKGSGNGGWIMGNHPLAQISTPRIRWYDSPNLVLRDINGNIIFNWSHTLNVNNWNTYKILFDGSQYTVSLNDSQVTIFNNSNVVDITELQTMFRRFDINLSYPGQLRYLYMLSDNGGELEYKFLQGNGNIVYDQIANNNANIIGATWNFYDTEIINTLTTISAIDSYQVFENIRNNAPTANPLAFMDTILTIPQKMVTYTDTFFSWIGFSYKDNILEPAAEVSSNLADNYKWYYDLFNWVRGFGE